MFINLNPMYLNTRIQLVIMKIDIEKYTENSNNPWVDKNLEADLAKGMVKYTIPVYITTLKKSFRLSLFPF